MENAVTLRLHTETIKFFIVSLSDMMETIVLCYIYPGTSISVRWCSLPPGNELHAPNYGSGFGLLCIMDETNMSFNTTGNAKRLCEPLSDLFPYGYTSGLSSWL